jgi:DNA-binding MarR family transcriptional regulator
VTLTHRCLLAETPSPAPDLTPLLRPSIIPCVTIQAWNRISKLSDCLPEQGAAPPQHPFLQGVTGDVDPTGLRLLRLVKTTANLYETVVSQALSAKGLSGPRWHLLIRLLVQEHRTHGAGLSPTDLSRCLNVSRNTVSALLRGLEEQGLIERTLDPDDKRMFWIRLSGAGRALVEASAPQHVDYLNGLVAGLAPAEQAQLIELLEKLYQSLTAHGIPSTLLRHGIP